MKFAEIPTESAEGTILGHGLRPAGKRFNKGRRLSKADIASLLAAGIKAVWAARVEDGDIDEDSAAGRPAALLAGPHMRAAAPFTGRANLYATGNGLALIDSRRIGRLNHIGGALTLATVAPYSPLRAGQMVATVKVIPFAVDQAQLAAASELLDRPPALSVAPFRPHRAGLVITRLPATADKIVAKTRQAVERRLRALGSELATVVECPHQPAAIEAALTGLAAKDLSPLLVAGASAIVDTGDVVPAAIERAGGEIVHFGMPVDPGNLSLMARLGDRPVIGLPGCARSPARNGFDWILERCLAGLPPGAGDIMAMGIGGLLKEIPARPLPREGRPESPAPTPRIAAVILAAGQSRRMGSANKLLQKIDGLPMLDRVVDAALASHAGPVVVVTGHQAGRIRKALGERPVTVVDNPRYGDGLSTSLIAGVDAVAAEADGVLVLLGDMPKLTGAHIDRLIAAFDTVEGREIIVPVCRGKAGNPVLFGRRFFPALKALSGDTGARALIGENSEAVCEVAVDDDAIFVDVDTPAALARLNRKQR